MEKGQNFQNYKKKYMEKGENFQTYTEIHGKRSMHSNFHDLRLGYEIERLVHTWQHIFSGLPAHPTTQLFC